MEKLAIHLLKATVFLPGIYFIIHFSMDRASQIIGIKTVISCNTTIHNKKLAHGLTLISGKHVLSHQ